MSNRMVKLLAVMVSSILAFSIFAGCGSTQKADETSKPAVSTSQTSQSGPENLTLPIVQSKLSLSCFMAMDSKISASSKTMNDMACYKELENKTGIHIDFVHPPIGQENDVLNLMIASNDLSDMIFWTWLTIPGGPAKAIQDGSIIKLNEHIDKYAPNIKKLFSEYSEVKKQSMLDDGTFYQFPMVRLRKDKQEWFKVAGPQIRKDWLDKLGLQPPKNTDELYNVLKAFQTKDPNGNGTPDELPFLASKDTGNVPSGNSIKNFSSPWGILIDFYNDNGKVKFGPIEPGFKQYISTMNKWFKEQLIDPDFAVTDGKSFDAKVTGNRGGFYIGALNGNLTRYLTLMKDKDPKFDLAALPWISGPAGKAYTSAADYNKLVVGIGKAVSAKNKHIKETVKWMDYFYSEEGSRIMNFGIEGTSYTMQNGKPVFTDKVMKNTTGLSVDQALSQYAMSAANDAFVKDPVYFEQVSLLLPQQKASQTAWDPADKSLLLPPITSTTEESSKLAAIMNEVNTYTNEMVMKFIMGQEPVDNFDKYVKNIKSMGIDEAIKLQQAALDRYNGRK